MADSTSAAADSVSGVSRAIVAPWRGKISATPVWGGHRPGLPRDPPPGFTADQSGLVTLGSSWLPPWVNRSVVFQLGSQARTWITRMSFHPPAERAKLCLSVAHCLLYNLCKVAKATPKARLNCALRSGSTRLRTGKSQPAGRASPYSRAEVKQAGDKTSHGVCRSALIHSDQHAALSMSPTFKVA